MVSSLPEYAREIKRALNDPRAVCEKLGLLGGPREHLRQTGGGVTIRCPFHGEHTPSCSVRRTANGIGVKCFGCDVGGDVLSLIAQVHGLNTRSDFKKVLTIGAEMAGLWAIVEDLEGRTPRQDRPVLVPAVAPPPPEPERDYPPAGEVARAWDGGLPVADDNEARAWFVGRGIDPKKISADVARVVARAAQLPRWASYRGESWTRTGHRVLVPMRGPGGDIRSVRGVRNVDGDSPKRLPPGGHKASGIVMACTLAASMLAGFYQPKRVLVVEGEPDFFAAVAWELAIPTAVIGLVSGGWSPRFAPRIPVGAEVLLWTDRDAAGDRYAADVARDLQRSRGCRLKRWAPEKAG